MSPTPAAPSASRRRCCRRSGARPMSPTCAPNTRKIAAAHARAQADKKRLPLADARANALKIDWSRNTPPQKPAFLGTRSFDDYDLAELADYIDWTPFFQTWELNGRYPGDPRRRQGRRGGARALRRRAGDAATRSSTRTGSRRSAVDRLLAGQRRRRRHRGLCRRQRASSRSRRLHTLRQQLREARRPRQRRRCRISSRRVEPACADYVGAFVVTAGIGEDAVAERFKRANDDYSSILVQGAGRPARRSLRRAHARARAQGVLGLRAGRDAAPRRADRASNIGASARRPAIRRSPTTPRRRRCSACSMPRARPA